MIWFYILKFTTTVLSLAFEWLPRVDALPQIMGVNVDAAFTNGVNEYYQYIHALWYLEIMTEGALVFLGYLGLFMLVKLFIGSRVPH